MGLKEYIQTNVIFINEQDTMQTAIKTMIDKEVGSVLVKNEKDDVVGILTERDIVRKFTLLEMADKLKRMVATVMSRPVKFVSAAHLIEDIKRIHAQSRIRHFPILSTPEPKVKNVMGIASITDLGRTFLASGITDIAEKKGGAQPLVILAKNHDVADPTVKIFRQMGYAVDIIQDVHAYVQKNPDMKVPLLFDMDGYTEKELKSIVAAVNKYLGDTIIITHNVSLVALFQKFVASERKYIAIKPLDFSYCHWLLTQKWTRHS